VNKTIQTVESAAHGRRKPAQWGGIRLRIDPMRDPAPLFRRLA
jgi:starch synthase (maltosyl-transferring)